MSATDLILHKKVEDLFYRVYPSFRNYPKAEKHSLCHQIKTHFIELLKLISLANSVKSKRLTFLQEADGTLENLTVLMRLSRNMKYISLGFFGLIDIALSEIKALLIGYLKSAIKPRSSQFSAT